MSGSLRAIEARERRPSAFGAGGLAFIGGLVWSALARAQPVPLEPAPRDVGAETGSVPRSDAPLELAPSTWGDREPTPPTPDEERPSPGLAPPLTRPERGWGPGRPSEPPRTASVRYTLESIVVRGNARTGSNVVLRYVPFKVGDVFDVDDPEVELSRYRLLGTGFFRDVQFSLKKGTARGFVRLVIDVTERNTIVINDIQMGLSADADTEGHARPLSAYAGLDIAETNLAGTGITLGSGLVVADNQLALRVRFLDPAFFGSRWMFSGSLLYNDANDYFGNARVLWNYPGAKRATDSAVVDYSRFGGSLGVGRDLSVSTQLWLHYRLETINANYPLEASHHRGYDIEPIDFDVIRGRSVLSTLRGTLQVDTRDHPFLPTRGWLATVTTEVGLLPASRDYDYQRVDVQASHWWRLPWHGHVLRLSGFVGAIAGDAPFFEQYYVGDFSDFLPDRVLGVNFDRRPPKNFLGTEIVEVRYGKYAFSLGSEYRIPLYRGRHTVFGVDLFASGGLYGVASDRDLTSPPTGYSGFARVPVDLTANLGFRVDTSAGGFVFAFSNVLGFIPVRGEGPAGE